MADNSGAVHSPPGLPNIMLFLLRVYKIFLYEANSYNLRKIETKWTNEKEINET